MIEGTVNKKAFRIPTNFEEFESKHWKIFTKILTDFRIQSWDDVKIAFLMKLLKLPIRKLLRIEKSKKFRDVEEFEERMSQLSILAENYLGYFETPPKVNINHFRKVRRGLFRRPLYGPSDNLGNVQLWEYAKAEYAADDFMYNENNDALNELFAILYRFKKPFWFIRKYFAPADIRRKFHDDLIQYYTLKAKRVPRRAKLFLYNFFQSVRADFPAHFKHLYNQKSDGDGDGKGWKDIIVAFENTVPGDEEKIGRTPIWWILTRMDHMAERADEMKQETNKSNGNL